MNPSLLNEIVNAVLYEGYILYPYRSSSCKNRRERFTFGRVYPEAYSTACNGIEPCVMQTECLLNTSSTAGKLTVHVRFLHPLAREIGAFEKEPDQLPIGTDSNFVIVSELRVNETVFLPWHEAVERDVSVPVLTLDGHSAVESKIQFRFCQSCETEPIRNAYGKVAGLILRRQETVEGVVHVAAQPLQPDLWKITVRVRNQSACTKSATQDSEALLLRVFTSTHTILTVESGEFISLMDPSLEFKSAAAECQNIGAWPVLVGDESKGERDTMLSSPIILYDYPKIAPESAGPLFDGTEIDEILTLRILTMTDGEKREMRNVDEQARRLLERTETLSSQTLLGMHGTMRPAETARVEFDDFFWANTPLQGVDTGGVFLKAGDRVRIRPKARADVMDMAMAGQTAVIESVEEDLEKRIHLALVLENDPGKDLGLMRQPGHRFFYGVDEVEPIKEGM